MVRILRVMVCAVVLLVKLVGTAYAEETAPTTEGLLNIPPSPPSEVTVAGIEDDRANVAWQPVPDATQYTVWVDGTRWTASVGPGATLKGLQAYTEYTVYVTASNSAGESLPSESVSFRTLPPVPDAPAISIKAVHSDGAVVEWPALPAWQHVMIYRIYVDGQLVADVEAQDGVQQAELTNLDEGQHYVAVSGVNENREGPVSQSLHFIVRTVNAPASLVLANRGNEWALVSWDRHLDAEKYKVLVNGVLAGETHENSYLLQGLEPGTQYRIGVVAVSDDGVESRPAELDVTTASWGSAGGNLDELIASVYGYVPDVMPGIIVVFAIGGALKIARSGKYALGARRF